MVCSSIKKNAPSAWMLYNTSDFALMQGECILLVQALVDTPAPRNVTQLTSFLGILNFYAKFIPNSLRVTAPSALYVTPCRSTLGVVSRVQGSICQSQDPAHKGPCPRALRPRSANCTYHRCLCLWLGGGAVTSESRRIGAANYICIKDT